MRLEGPCDPMAPTSIFTKRLLVSTGVAFSGIAISLAIGVVGYHALVHSGTWIDCIYSASMILGGMGPVGKDPADDVGKLFASAYAIYSGVTLLTSVGILLSPAIHRIMHHFHVAVDEDGDDDAPEAKPAPKPGKPA
jgi:hypothetical protein